MSLKLYRYIIAFILVLTAFSESNAYEVCDSLRACTGRALTMTVPYGKGAHYVDVDRSQAQNNITDQMTLEFWMKPTRQPGKVQFIVGLWGPGRDKNDVWVLYINQNDELVFELNGNQTDLDRLDNTVASTPADSLYDTWNHITAVFDGITQSAYIYINNVMAAVGSNSEYPLSSLRILQKKDLPIQIGSCNSLSDDKNLYRTFLGQIDEIRLWSRVLSPDEIYCNRLKSLSGSEPGLVLYYRCNEHEHQYNLCDASGNGSTGRARSGTVCTDSDRRNIPTFFIQEPTYNIIDTLKCDTTWSIAFTVVDTSRCGNRVYFIFRDDLMNSYTLNPPYINYNNAMILEQNVPQQVTVTLNSDFLGDIATRFYAVRTNACDNWIRRNFLLTRISELDYNLPSIDYDTIKANCMNNTPFDTVLTICNNSRAIGNPRTMTVSDIQNSLSSVFEVVGSSFPISLAPDSCIDLTVRFNSNVSPGLYEDSLVILSDDRCVESGIIPLRGVATEILRISDRSGANDIDTIDFGTVCVNWPSDAVEFMWTNLIQDDIFVDSIIVPEHLISSAFDFPELVEPETGYLPYYFRFLPSAEGVFLDSIVFMLRTNDCISEKKVYIKGVGFFADVQFTANVVDFGNVKVGQETELDVSIENRCDEQLNVSFYLKNGEVFFFSGGRSVTISPGQTRSVRLKFVPLEEKSYVDELCLFEQRCYTSSCIEITGNGYIEKFDFTPTVMKTENVIGCQSQLDTLSITNLMSSPTTISNFVLDNLPSQKYSAVYPQNLSTFSKTLNQNDSAQFIFRFTPNNVLNDIGERAYLRYQTDDGQEWSAKLLGTSVVPKIFVLDEILFGQVEVGDSKRDTVEIYNYSPVPIRIDSIIVTSAYNLIYPNITAPVYLQPRDSIMAIIDFVPDSEKGFTGDITVYSGEPCEVDGSGFLLGNGIVIPLEIPISVISNGFIRPCDCEVRKVNLINQSYVFPRTIDSIWIDTTGIPNSNPDFFSWTAWGSPTGTLPFDIEPLSFDTLYIKFCPRTPAQRQFIDIAANLVIKASGDGWEGEQYIVHMIGKRQLLMEPTPGFAYFPPTRVDTFSNVSRFVDITIPELEVNPDRENVRIDSIRFEPEERVFYVTDTLGNQPPFIVSSSSTLTLKVDYKPRAVRPYLARMHIYMSEPCDDKDTTVWVYGESFAPSFGLDFNFENNRIFPDTIRANYCDTVKVDVFSSRNFPADIVDIRLALLYDTTKFEYLYADSPYLRDTCFAYPPFITDGNYETFGKSLLLKNFCTVDSSRPFVSAYFLPISADRDTFSIKIDSIYFDTEEVILYQIIAQVDSALIIILKPDFEVLNSIDFDSVQVLDCAYDTLFVRNIGDVPIRMDDLDGLPEGLRIFESIPIMGEFYNPGDTATIILEYCPRRKDTVDNQSFTNSLKPCELIDDFNIIGEAWAPDFPVLLNSRNQFNIKDSISVTLGDTVTIPIFIENDFSVSLRNQTFWLQDFDFETKLTYNKYSLKYLNTTNRIGNGDVEIDYSPGELILKYSGVDSLMQGVIAENRFLVTVPDSAETMIFIQSENYFTDSIMFVNIIPVDNYAYLFSNGKCMITTLEFDENAPYLFSNYPNPWTESTTIDFYLAEEAVVEMTLYTSSGVEMFDVVSREELSKGLHSIDISSELIPAGIYLYVMKTGTNTLTRKMVVIK